MPRPGIIPLDIAAVLLTYREPLLFDARIYSDGLYTTIPWRARPAISPRGIGAAEVS